MNQFDKKIRQMAKKTSCPTSKEYDEKIDHILETIKDREPNTAPHKSASFSFKKAGIAACALAAAALVCVPVSAKISDYVKERMEQMEPEEQTKYVEANNSQKMTKEHDTEALLYSRDLSTDENNRYAALRDKYRSEGLFPEEALEIVEKLEDGVQITSPIYETYNRKIFLPERNLTDEELLQMIDFSEKSAYAVSHTPEAQEIIQAQQEFNKNPYPDETDLSEEAAITRASAYLKEMYDIDCSGMDVTAEYWMGYGFDDYGDYEVIFKGEDNTSYNVDLNGKNGRLSMLSIAKDGIDYSNFSSSPAAADEAFLRSNYENAKKLLTSAFNSDVTVTKATCGYTVNADGKAENGRVFYFIELSNDAVYGIQYSIENDFLGYIYQLSAEGWPQDDAPTAPGFVVLQLEP